MTTTYKYTREIKTVQVPGEEEKTGYDINNWARRDGENNRIFIDKEIKNSILNSKFKKTNFYNETADIIFENELTPEEKSTLDTIVYNHKNNL